MFLSPHVAFARSAAHEIVLKELAARFGIQIEVAIEVYFNRLIHGYLQIIYNLAAHDIEHRHVDKSVVPGGESTGNCVVTLAKLSDSWSDIIDYGIIVYPLILS